MKVFEIDAPDISALNDADLRELVGRLCEAEIVRGGHSTSCVTWGGAQEAPDGGLDVRVKDGPRATAGFVPRADTGFQVKKHSLGKVACQKEMQGDGKPKQIIETLAAKCGAYIIVSGKDDCSETMLAQRLFGMNTAVTSMQNRNDLLLDFYGRDRISTWLRQHPGVVLWVRLRLGKPLSGWKPFGRWAATLVDQEDTFLFDDHPCVVDKNAPSKDPMTVLQGIQLTRDRLRRPGSTVRITGLSGVGKTRFAQALFETKVGAFALPASAVIYADLGEKLEPTASELAAYLIANDLSAYVILDNCPSDIHRHIQKQLATSRAKLHLLTSEYDISDDDHPEETEVIHIDPSSVETISALVQRRFTELESVNAGKIADFAGGNARIALALASRVKADETLSNFSDDDLFRRLFSQRQLNSDALMESAEALSLIYSFNVSRSEFHDELSVIEAIAGISRGTLYRHQAELLRRQLAQQRGNWRAVLPQALANRLAKRALENIALDDINAELFKPENYRLFRSCAHRLGFLHDSGPAQQLANSWIAPGGPLGDIASCDQSLLQVLDYIAPVFPKTILAMIERASRDACFASRKNPYFDVFARLLCHLAYEDDDFDMAAAILLKFAESEKYDEKRNSVVARMRHLFALHLSGTRASPARRQAFVENLVQSGQPRHREIAGECLQAAFEISHWTSFANVDFGARQRDFGWRPQTYGEMLDWYVAFVSLLRPALGSADADTQSWAKRLLVSHFSGLWTSAGCFDVLEKVVCDHASGGAWPELWIYIRRIISHDRGQHSLDVLERLKALERIAAPADTYREMEAFALSSLYDHVSGVNDNYASQIEELNLRVAALGEIAASAPHYLERLGTRLWTKHFDAMVSFGRGLAIGSADRTGTFGRLISTLQSLRATEIQPVLLCGFFRGLHETDSNLARILRERILTIPELKPHFVYLLGACPIDQWGVQTLKDLARGGEFEAWRFENLKSGRLHETISDHDLCDILRAVNALDQGPLSSLAILSMRFFVDAQSTYKPSEDLLGVGRAAILALLSLRREGFDQRTVYGLDKVVKECLSASAPKDEVVDIVNTLCREIAADRVYDVALSEVTEGLIKTFPEIVLDSVFAGAERQSTLVHLLFTQRVDRSELPLNLVPVDRLLNWCNGDQRRIMEIAGAVSSYTTIEPADSPFDNPKRVALSAHIKALMDAADDKSVIVEIIYLTADPVSGSGSLADILDVRSKAVAELLQHPERTVRELAKEKVALLENAARDRRVREARENSQREQRFE